MTVRPVDLQTLIPRSGEVGRIQQVRDNESAVAQHQAAAQFRVRSEEGATRVAEMPTPEKAQVQTDADGKGRKDRQERARRSGRQHEDRSGQPGPAEPGKGLRLDIKL
jgi:hypothetical protein